MPVISARITEELETEIEEHIKEEGLEKSVAVRKLISSAIKEWRKEKALKMLSEGTVSFLRAAKLADMNVWDFSALVRMKKIIWIKDESVLKDLE